MDNTLTTFDPTQWVNNETQQQGTTVPAACGQPQGSQVMNPQQTVTDPSAEQQKAQAVCDALLRLGANIAESYDDYLKLGFALADGLGPQGHDIYHRLCAQSTKYREADCEKKWQECMAKHDGRTTIASFYMMAQQAGVDLSEIGRRFPSFPPFPPLRQGSAQTGGAMGLQQQNSPYLVDNKIAISNKRVASPQSPAVQNSRGGVAEVAGNATAEELLLDASRIPNPTFSDKLCIDDLPPIVRDGALLQDTPEGHDKVILGIVDLASGFISNVSGVYDKRRVFAPIFLQFVGPSGADKGILPACKALVDPIVWEIREQYDKAHKEYLQQKAQYDALEKKAKAEAAEPEEPLYRSPLIAVNASATAFYQDLAANDGWGAVFETEADVLTQAIKQDYGDYSSGLRKAFHHETIDYSRRKDNEHVFIKMPRLSVLLTCTPGQVPLLLSPQNVENGLANRFVFYFLRKSYGWRNVFEDGDETLYDQMAPLGRRFKELCHELETFAGSPLKFTLNEEQKVRFNEFFQPLYEEQTGLYGDDLEAFVFRLGLTTFRIAMTLTVLRHEEMTPHFSPEGEPLVCCDKDFQTSLTIADCLINHTVFAYKNLLPHNEAPLSSSGKRMSAQELAFLQALPSEFTRKEYLAIAKQMGIAERTAERYVGAFWQDYYVVARVSTGHYRKR